MLVWRKANKLSQTEASKKLGISVRAIKRVEAIGRWPKHVRARVVDNAELIKPTHLKEIASRRLTVSQLEYAVGRVIGGKYPFVKIDNKKDVWQDPDHETLALQERLQRGLGSKKVKLRKIKDGEFDILFPSVGCDLIERLC